MTKFKVITADQLPVGVYGGSLPVAFSRSQLLILQYAKLLNYFSDDLEPDWGGDFFLSPDAQRVDKCLDRFLTDTLAFDSDVKERWIHKKFEELPWGPGNFRLRSDSCTLLGAPYEAYLSINGALLTMAQASRLLCIDAAALVKVKLKLLYDERVISEAVRQLLRPRPLWPKIEMREGNGGRIIR